MLILVLAAGIEAKAQSNSAPVRLAVIVSDASAATAADLLAVELTKTARLQLLERAEIDRIRREQGLSAANKDNLKLGQVLGADGLLLLEPAKEGTNQFLTARLVAVKPGVVIGSFRSPWPVADPAQWARWISARFGPLFPKLGVLVKDAVPISVVNLRSAVRSSGTEEEERQLTALAIERLTQERELFVLERRRMDLLSDEKELKGLEESAFWDGSFLLDGVLDRDGYSKETMTLNARLTPPKGGAPVSIEIKGSRTNLTDIVNQLADKVTRELKLSPGAAWNPADEADQYFEEAGWELKWGMLKEAEAAGEASWSLGKQTREVAEFRILVYHKECETIHESWLDSSPTSPAYAPVMTRLAPTIHALQLYQRDFQAFLAADSTPDKKWQDLAGSLLNSAYELLRRCFYFPDAWRGREEDVAELRRLARETVAMMNRHPAYKMPFEQLASLQLGIGVYWQETPGPYMELCHEIARSNLVGDWGITLAYNRPIAWNKAEQARVPELWRQFVQELRVSTNVLSKVYGYYLDFADAKSDEEYTNRGVQLFQQAAQNAYYVVAANRTERLTKDIEYLLAGPPRGYSASPVGDEMHRYYYDTYRADFASNAFVRYLETDDQFNAQEFTRFGLPMSSVAGDGFLASPERVRKVLSAMESYKARLTEKQKERPIVFDYWNYNSFQGWLKRGLPSGPQPVVPPTNAVAGSRGTGPPGNAAPTARTGRPPPAPYIAPTNNGPPVVKTTSGNVVGVTRFWRMPSDLSSEFLSFSDVPTIKISESKYREKRIWFEVCLMEVYDYKLSRAFIYGVDLNNFQTETIELPLAKTVLDLGDIKQELLSTGDSFEVIGDSVYFNGEDKIRCYSLRTKSWEVLPVPVQGRTTLTAINGRLFIITPDTVLEMHEDGKGAEILASGRRRPAVNQLDTLGGYGPVLLGPNGSPRLCVNGKIYSRNQSGNDWSEVLAFPDMRGTSIIACDGRIVLREADAQFPSRLWLLSEDQSTFETALIIPAVPPPRFDAMTRRNPPDTNSPAKTRWKYPGAIPIALPPTTLDGDNLWIFTGQPSPISAERRGNPDPLAVYYTGELTVRTDAKVGAIFDEYAGRHALLLEFQKGQAEPRQIPLWFNLKEWTFSRLWLERFRHYDRSESINLGLSVFQTTPEGLVITCTNVPGFWLIPRSDLEAAPGTLDPNARLLVATEEGDLATVKEMLAGGAPVDARNFHGWTPLIIAAKAGNLELARLLIEKGADVNAKATVGGGATALCYAALGNNLDVVRELLKHGAAVNAPANSGMRPLYYAAITHGIALAELLISRGADLEAYGSADVYGRQYTPLMGAALEGDSEMVELLLAKGAKIENTGSAGDTALMSVAKTEHAEIVKLLLAKGANVNATGPKGHTALIYAAYNGQLEAIRLLLAAGANPLARARDSDIAGGQDYDAITMARQQHHPEAQGLIAEALAKAAAAKK
jgi:ankyrin repeat protein